MEIFKVDGSKELHGVVYLSNIKSKNYDTVIFFKEKCIDYVRQLGYNVTRYDRITDGCSSQFWCYGSFYHLENMPLKFNIPLVTEHRYESYEGKNFSDALGSLLKQNMREGALQNKTVGKDEQSIISLLDDIDDDTDLDDLVFQDQYQAFEWLQMVMSKAAQSNFSKSFKQIKLFWIPKEEIPSNLVQEKDCKKVSKVKTFNTATASINQTGVHVRDSTCYDCDHCLQGNLLSCKSKNNGEWKHYVIAKDKQNTKKPTHNIDNDIDSRNEEFE